MIKNKKFTKVGVIGFGGYVPRYRLKVTEIAKVRGKDGDKISQSLMVDQKAVADKDEDTVSLSWEAASRALTRTKMNIDDIGAVLVGSESHPYAVKPTGTIVAEMLGLKEEYYCADLEFACKAGTTGMMMIAAMIEAGMIKAGLAIGADVAQSRPGGALEYTAGAGAAAIILGNRQYQWYAQLEKCSSLNSDTTDFWRREGADYPQHAGRFSGEPGYFHHVVKGSNKFLKVSKEKISDFDHVILHMPNGKFTRRAGLRLQVTEKQMKVGFLVREIGNPYSASAMLGLINVLEQTNRGNRVLVTSYGSGAGSDSFSLNITKKLKNTGIKGIDLKTQLNNIEHISYPEYLLKRGMI